MDVPQRADAGNAGRSASASGKVSRQIPATTQIATVTPNASPIRPYSAIEVSSQWLLIG